MGEEGQEKYLTRVEVYNLVRAGELFGISLIGENAIPALKTLIEEGEYWEKTRSIEAISNMGTDKANRLLKAILESSDWQLREFTLGILAGKKIPWLDRKIWEMAEKDPSIYVQAKAAKIMRARTSESPISSVKRRRRVPDNIGNRKVAGEEAIQRA